LTINDGYGTALKVNYQTLGNNFNKPTGVYKAELTPLSDTRHVKVGSTVKAVKRISKRNGIGGFNHTDYSYEDGIFHTQGRGFQGFKKIVAKNLTGNTTTSTEFSQKFPNSGAVIKKTIRRTSDNHLISLFEASSAQDKWCSEQNLYF
jgi:hypothetical protein